MMVYLRMTTILALSGMAAFSEWSGIGLGDSYCEKIEIHEGRYYVATDNGIRTRGVNDSNSEWKSIGPGEGMVLDFIIFDSHEIIASRHLRNDLDPSDTVSIFRTIDGGTTWEPYQNGFGGPNAVYYGHAVCTHLEHDSAKPDTLYARGPYVAAKSYDRGQSWTVIYPSKGDGMDAWGYIGYQATIMKIDDYVPGRIWVGGEASLFQGYLAKSLDYGDTWVTYSQDDFFEQNPGDNACYTVVPNPVNARVLLLGMEGYIFKSADEGETWTLSYESPNYTYIMDMENSPTTENRIYATGSDNGTVGGNLFFLISDDFGETWQKENDSEIPDGRATNDLLIFKEQSRDVLIFATNDGVFKYAEPPTHTGRLPESAQTNRRNRPQLRLSGLGGEHNEIQAKSRTLFDLSGKRIADSNRSRTSRMGIHIAKP